MIAWKGKALDYLPNLRERILAAKDRQSLWREVEREFYAAAKRDDSACAAGCLRYAAWTRHPTPQAKTVADVSEAAARFLHGRGHELPRWMNRCDFMVPQKGLRIHLGDREFSEFESSFLEKTARSPGRNKANKHPQPNPR